MKEKEDILIATMEKFEKYKIKPKTGKLIKLRCLLNTNFKSGDLIKISPIDKNLIFDQIVKLDFDQKSNFIHDKDRRILVAYIKVENTRDKFVVFSNGMTFGTAKLFK